MSMNEGHAEAAGTGVLEPTSNDAAKPARPIRRRRLRRGALVLTSGLVLWLTVSWIAAYQLTRRPRAWFAEPAPGVAWGVLEDHRLTTRDGHELGAWFVEGRPEAPSVLLMHGHRGSRGDCLNRAEILTKAGCSVLLISLRAHGDSTGDFNDIGYSARHDVIAAIDWLERRRPAAPILIHGTSMGAAAAAFAAGELKDRIRGYLLESPYRDLKTAVRNRTENLLPPILDRIAFAGLIAVSPLVLPDLDRIAPVEAVASIPADVPVLILAGGRDIKAHPHEARAIHQRLAGHGELVIFDEAEHVGFLKVDPKRYERLVLDFVERIRLR